MRERLSNLEKVKYERKLLLEKKKEIVKDFEDQKSMVIEHYKKEKQNLDYDLRQQLKRSETQKSLLYRSFSSSGDKRNSSVFSSRMDSRSQLRNILSRSRLKTEPEDSFTLEKPFKALNTSGNESSGELGYSQSFDQGANKNPIIENENSPLKLDLSQSPTKTIQLASYLGMKVTPEKRKSRIFF